MTNGRESEEPGLDGNGALENQPPLGAEGIAPAHAMAEPVLQTWPAPFPVPPPQHRGAALRVPRSRLGHKVTRGGRRCRPGRPQTHHPTPPQPQPFCHRPGWASLPRRHRVSGRSLVPPLGAGGTGCCQRPVGTGSGNRQQTLARSTALAEPLAGWRRCPGWQPRAQLGRLLSPAVPGQPPPRSYCSCHRSISFPHQQLLHHHGLQRLTENQST